MLLQGCMICSNSFGEKVIAFPCHQTIPHLVCIDCADNMAQQWQPDKCPHCNMRVDRVLLLETATGKPIQKIEIKGVGKARVKPMRRTIAELTCNIMNTAPKDLKRRSNPNASQNASSAAEIRVEPSSRNQAITNPNATSSSRPSPLLAQDNHPRKSRKVISHGVSRDTRKHLRERRPDMVNVFPDETPYRVQAWFDHEGGHAVYIYRRSFSADRIDWTRLELSARRKIVSTTLSA